MRLLLQNQDECDHRVGSLGNENLSSIANCFAKHIEKVCKKYYVRHFSEREAARLSWECYSRYKPSEDATKASKIRAAAIKRCRVPNVKSIKKWLNDVVAKVKLVSNETVEDENLMKGLEKFSLEQGT